MESKEETTTAEEGKKTIERTDLLVQMMDDIVDKLQLLEYEKNMALVKKKRCMPCSRFYFCLADSNANAQFNYFMDLVMFLTQQCQRDFIVDKYDDPNTSVNKLLLLLKSMSIEINFSAAKVKLGHGEAVCTVLQRLSDVALEQTKFQWTAPSYPKEEFADEAEVDEDAEVDGGVEENLNLDTNEEEEVVLYSEKQTGKHPADALDESQHEIIQATVDPIAWKTELERVAPKLKARVRADVGKEWRAHIEQTRAHEDTIQKVLPATSSQLKQVALELGEALERMSHKEKYINQQFCQLGQEYHDAKDRLVTLQETHQASSERVKTVSTTLSTLSEHLSDIKSKMDNRGSSMTDTTPLVNIKEALQTLKMEIKTYELRIGIVGHSLLQATSRIKPRPEKNDDVYHSTTDPAYDDGLSDDEYYEG